MFSPSKDDKCPNQSVTARCRVRKPASRTHLLLWQCDDDTGTNERVILCNNNPVLELYCQFGTLYDIKSSCICDDTVIESEATFNTTSLCDMMIYCSDGEEVEGISVSIKGDIQHPTLISRCEYYYADRGYFLLAIIANAIVDTTQIL